MNREFPNVKRILPALVAVVVLASLAWGQAKPQGDPFVGTWKLNVAKSKYKPGPAPKDQTRAWEPSGKVVVTGTSATGSPTGYGYVVNYGHPSPVTGVVGSGGDTVVFTQINKNTVEANFTMKGKHVETARMALTKGGKIMNLKAKGVLPNGMPFETVAVWEKQ